MTLTLFRPPLHGLLLVLALASAGSAFAIQPPDTGARPLAERVAAIDQENQALAQRLRSEQASPEEKSKLRARQEALAKEKRDIEKEQARLAEQKNSPLFQFIKPGEGGH